MPEACGPRNEGQLPLAGAGRAEGRACDVSVIFLAGLTAASPAGDQVLRSRIICRTLHSSATRSNVRCLSTVVTRYLPGPSQPPGPPLIRNSTSDPWLFQLPLSLGQPCPSSVSVPAGSKRTRKAPNFKGSEGREALR